MTRLVAARAAALARVVAGAVLSVAILGTAAAQSDHSVQADIRAALTQWATDFNAGKSDRVCALFARDLIAQYRGQPERNYDSLCDLLKRSLDVARRSLAMRSTSRKSSSPAISPWYG